MALKVKKRPKHVEEHYDECGDDISSLSMELDTFVLDEAMCFECAMDDVSDAEVADQSLGDGLTSFMLWGSHAAPVLLPPLLVYVAANMDEAYAVRSRAGGGIDIAEICGGEARSPTISVRRRLTVGRNFDLVTKCGS